ncbi:hypothetical protein PG987_013564 [Apiospora arundinis]
MRGWPLLLLYAADDAGRFERSERKATERDKSTRSPGNFALGSKCKTSDRSLGASFRTTKIANIAPCRNEKAHKQGGVTQHQGQAAVPFAIVHCTAALALGAGVCAASLGGVAQ